MKRIIKVLYAIVILVLLASCSNDFNYPKTYVYDGFQCGAIKLYSNSGEITDTTIINNYLSRLKRFNWFKEPNINLQGEIVIYSSKKGAIYDLSGTEYLKNISRKDGALYFENTDTTSAPYSLMTQFLDERVYYGPSYFIPADQVKGTDYRYVQCVLYKENGQTLEYPILYYYEKFDFPHFASAEGLNNVFDEDYLTKVYSNNEPDTIAIQQNRVVYLKK